MFYGQSEHNIDSKGRMFIPGKFKDMLSEGLTLSFGVDHILNIMTAQEWAAYENEAKEKLQLTRDREAFRRIFGFSVATTMDSQGRITIPEAFMKYAGITDKAIMVGCGRRIEVWSAERWQEYMDNLNFGDIAESLIEYGL